MIKELCDYIEDETSFVVGTSLFAVSEDFDIVDTCVVVTEPSPGLADGILTDLRQIPLVAYSRALTKFTARDNAYTLFDLLHGTYQVSLPVIGSGPVYVCNFTCRTPYYVGLDETNRRYVYSVPVDVHVTNML